MKHLFEEKGPIGAVVREADQLFSNITRRTSFNGSFNRLEWHYFNFLKERKRVSEAEVMDYLSFFDSETRIQKAIDRFQREGLAKADADGMYLSQKGEKVFEEVVQVQEMIKEKSVLDISPEAYSITMDTLQKIMDNLQEYLPRETEKGAC